MPLEIARELSMTEIRERAKRLRAELYRAGGPEGSKEERLRLLEELLYVQDELISRMIEWRKSGSGK